MSVLCEWCGFDIDGKKADHLDLGFETALTAVETKARTREEVLSLVAEANAS